MKEKKIQKDQTRSLGFFVRARNKEIFGKKRKRYDRIEDEIIETLIYLIFIAEDSRLETKEFYNYSCGGPLNQAPPTRSARTAVASEMKSTSRYRSSTTSLWDDLPSTGIDTTIITGDTMGIETEQRLVLSGARVWLRY